MIYIYILSMMAYTPLQIFSSELNYITAFFVAVTAVIAIKQRVRADLTVVNYYLILLSVFLINFAFGYEVNYPWFYNHLAFILTAFIVTLIYSNSSDNNVTKWQAVIARFNDYLSIAVVLSMGVLFFYPDGYIDFVSANYNGMMWQLTQILGWHKAHISVVAAYCIIWIAMTKKRNILFLYIILISPVLLAGRSIAVALLATLILVYFSKLLFKYRIVWILVLPVVAVIWTALLLVEINVPAVFVYDRAANFMVAIELANNHFFGHGNGTYHWYVESNQYALDARYGYLFSPYQAEVFLGPESMFNHVIGSFGYFLSFIFFILQALTFYWSYINYSKVNQFEKFIILFWFTIFIAGIGQTLIMIGFPYFVMWGLVIAIHLRSKSLTNINRHTIRMSKTVGCR